MCTWALSSVEERPFRIREAEGSNPSVSTFADRAEKTKKVDVEGFEPSAFRMQNGRSSTELNARAVRKEATEGIEPSTLGLQDRCSATEPSRHTREQKTPAAGIEPATSSSVARCSSIEPRGRSDLVSAMTRCDDRRNRGLTVKILAFQARDPGSTPGGCTFSVHRARVAQWKRVGFRSRRLRVRPPPRVFFGRLGTREKKKPRHWGLNPGLLGESQIS